jgi:hypothetical protein
MDIIELYRYLRLKEPILGELREKTTELMEVFAERDFPLPPGPLQKGILDLNLLAREGLREANAKVVEAEITEEIRQSEIDNRKAIEAARMVFDADKSALLNALELEMAELETGYDLAEEELKLTALEIDRREILLIEAKTAIDLEKEEIRRELAKTDRLTWDTERLLLFARLETAQEKLKIIPYLSALLAKEREILEVLRANAGIEEELIGAQEGLIEAKEDLLPLVSEKANRRSELADARLIQAGVDRERIILALQKAVLERQKTDAAVLVAQGEREHLDLQKDRSQKRNLLERERIQDRIDLIRKRMDANRTITAEKSRLISDLSDLDQDIASIRRTQTEQMDQIERSAREGTTDLETYTDALSMIHRADYSAWGTVEAAKASAIAQITAGLIHLIAS